MHFVILGRDNYRLIFCESRYDCGYLLITKTLTSLPQTYYMSICNECRQLSLERSIVSLKCCSAWQHGWRIQVAMKLYPEFHHRRPSTTADCADSCNKVREYTAGPAQQYRRQKWQTMATAVRGRGIMQIGERQTAGRFI